MIDFSKLGVGSTVDTIINPRELFSALPHKDSKYQYPRDVQADVLKQWNDKRNDENIVIKMNTGSGKTVVGLLILKSQLNDNKGPAVYVVPDNYLVEQVLKEAKSLGIKATTDATSIQFMRGKEILVCNIFKLINGKSVFGVGEQKIDIGSIIIDDAHACLDIVESQYTIEVFKENPAFKGILNLFIQSIKEQSEMKGMELELLTPNTQTLVPFWAWKQHISEVSKLLIENIESGDLKFTLPLLKDNLQLCRCVINERKIEITPHCIPIDIISSLKYAKNKIFMTATLVDDSILSTHFDLDRKSLSNVISPDVAGDIGERMILVPEAINPKIKEDDLKKYYKFLAKDYNVVIIVPSFDRAKYWEDVADLIIEKENIEQDIKALKDGHVGLAILVNRYDGIDLPQNACRVLVIDGLPDSRRMIDEINESQLVGSQKAFYQKIQKIEQGMGRGVRSNDDYCLVFLMGKKLIQQLYSKGAIDRLSQATKVQFELSDDMSQQLINKDLSDIHVQASEYSLMRKEEWVSVSKSVLASLTYGSSDSDMFAIAQREAYNEARINQYSSATRILTHAVNDLGDKDKILLGFSKQILAEYLNYEDELESQKVLVSAIKNNQNILKPKVGIEYKKIKTENNQAHAVSGFLSTKYGVDSNALLIDINAILSDIIFSPGTSNKFEEAIKNIAFYLGFQSHRPEKEYGKGPDNLWAVGDKNYFIIECKNGVTNETINKHDVNQLNGSIEWFRDEYDQTLSSTPIMIHLGDKSEHAATPNSNSIVITKDKIEIFKKNILDFCIALKGRFSQTTVIGEYLLTYKLRPEDIVSQYAVKMK
jgi:hypothetical protein